jgi:hypothetical protein
LRPLVRRILHAALQVSERGSLVTSAESLASSRSDLSPPPLVPGNGPCKTASCESC